MLIVLVGDTTGHGPIGQIYTGPHPMGAEKMKIPLISNFVVTMIAWTVIVSGGKDWAIRSYRAPIRILPKTKILFGGHSLDYHRIHSQHLR